MTLSDIIGRASDQLHDLIERIVVSWDEGAGVHHLDLTGDLVLLLSAGDNKKAAGLSSAACSLRLVAGARSNLHLRPEQVKMVAGIGVDHNLRSTPEKMVAGACTHLHLLFRTAA